MRFYSVVILAALTTAVSGQAPWANGTVKLTVGDLSPMMMFGSQPALYDNNGHLQLDSRGDRTASLDFEFVGVGVSVEGVVQVSATGGVLHLWDYWHEWRGEGAEHKAAINGQGSRYGYPLASSPVLDCRAYHGRLQPGRGSHYEIESLTYEIPVRTQAPLTLSEMKSQARVLSVVRGERLNPEVKILQASSFSQAALVSAAFLSFRNMTSKTAQWEVDKNAVVLRTFAELSYSIPKNTTLIEVLGPVGPLGDISSVRTNKNRCYVVIEPRPSWWSSRRVPTSRSFKPRRAVGQTLFLLPIDPDIQHTLHVGPVGPIGEDTDCVISHIRMYSFYYDYALWDKRGVEPVNTANQFPASAVAGAAVGSAAAVALVALAVALLYLRPRYERKPDRAAEDLFEVDHPEVITPFVPRSEVTTPLVHPGPRRALSKRVPVPVEAQVAEKLLDNVGSSQGLSTLETTASTSTTSEPGPEPARSPPLPSSPPQHAEDDAHATHQLLPPVYQSEWGDQHPQRLNDAAPVMRAERGPRGPRELPQKR